MAQLDFDPSDYSVTYQADKIILLAKEYALLQFLHSHRGQVFSREQLLDRVWPGEYPVERTVDDHIYRLRKRLKLWSDHVLLNTVRGYGYSLILRGSDLRNPSLQDHDLQEQVQNLLEKYLLLGQGKSMLALAKQQDLLGFEMDYAHQIYLRFVQADVDWFLERTEVPPSDKLYWILHFYNAFYTEPQKCLAYFERAIQSNIMPFEMQRELELLNILGHYADNGRIEEDLALVKAAYNTVAQQEGILDSFKVHIAMSEMYIYLMADDNETVEACAARIEEMLATTPYLREISSYHALKGRWLLRQGKRTEAIAAFTYGLEVGEMTQNIPLIINSIRGTLNFLEKHHKDQELYRQYVAKYDELDRRYSLTAYHEPITRMIENILNAV